MRCASWLPDYVAAMKDALPPGHPGFHPLNNGMDFRRPFRYAIIFRRWHYVLLSADAGQPLMDASSCRWGITGDYLRFTDVTFGDRLKFFSHRWIKPRLQRHRKTGSLDKA